MPAQMLIVGCGYLGRRVAARWQAAGHRVSALTRSQENAAAFAAQGITPLLGDVLRPETLRTLPAADVLLYAVGLDRSAGYSQREVYVSGLGNVLAQTADRVGRVIYISSTSVYGQMDGQWVDETSPCAPTQENGKVCRDAEELALKRLSGPPARLTLLRLSGIYGPGRLLARRSALAEQAPIPGNPEAWLNLIHVSDAARAVVACTDQRCGETFVVSDNAPVRRREFYGALARLTQSLPPVFANDDPENLGKRCCNAKLRAQLLPELTWPTLAQGLTDALGDG